MEQMGKMAKSGFGWGWGLALGIIGTFVLIFKKMDQIIEARSASFNYP